MDQSGEVAAALALTSSLAYGCADLLGVREPRGGAGCTRRPAVAESPRWSAAGGVLDSIANLLILLAARSGDLSAVAVIAALPPAGTVLLARSVLRERIGRVQIAGLGTAAVAVSLPAFT
ncbi:hypothetical protein ACFYTC_19475 [Actinomadura nitritigenes]|uniref:hypothetical protein n=1 Tax=Actinomadura nitritigenes TaxID=134602 RepID=UPI00367B6C06